MHRDRANIDSGKGRIESSDGQDGYAGGEGQTRGEASNSLTVMLRKIKTSFGWNVGQSSA